MAGFGLVHDKAAASKAGADVVRVVIVDSNPLMRVGLRGALERSADLVVAAEAADSDAAIMACQSVEADVVVLDCGPDSLAAFETVTTLKQQNPKLSVIVTYVSCSPHEIAQLAQAGAAGLIAKNAEPTEFVHAIRAVANGGSYFSSSLSGRPLRDVPSGVGMNLFGLSMREIEVLRLIVSGCSNKEVAQLLAISVRTVEAHRLNIRKKANANRLKDLMQLARRLGVSPAERSEIQQTDQDQPIIDETRETGAD